MWGAIWSFDVLEKLVIGLQSQSFGQYGFFDFHEIETPWANVALLAHNLVQQ